MSRPKIKLIEISRTELLVIAPKGSWYHNRFRTGYDPIKWGGGITHAYSVSKQVIVLCDQLNRTWNVLKGLQPTGKIHPRDKKSMSTLLVSIQEDQQFPPWLKNVISSHLELCKKTPLKQFRSKLPDEYKYLD